MDMNATHADLLAALTALAAEHPQYASWIGTARPGRSLRRIRTKYAVIAERGCNVLLLGEPEVLGAGFPEPMQKIFTGRSIAAATLVGVSEVKEVK